MPQPERLFRRDDAIGFAICLVLVLLGVFVLDGSWAFAVGCLGVSLCLEGLLDVWRRRG